MVERSVVECGVFCGGTHYNTRAAMHKLVKHVVLPCIKVVPSATAVERTNSHYKHVGGLRRASLTKALQEKLVFVYSNSRAASNRAQRGVKQGTVAGQQGAFKLGKKWEDLLECNAFEAMAVAGEPEGELDVEEDTEDA